MCGENIGNIFVFWIPVEGINMFVVVIIGNSGNQVPVF